MDKKLTLLLDEEVIYNAKKYVKKNGTSISNLLENYLKTIVMTSDESNTYVIEKLHPKVAQVARNAEKYRGKIPVDYDYKEAHEKALKEKYYPKKRKHD